MGLNYDRFLSGHCHAVVRYSLARVPGSEKTGCFLCGYYLGEMNRRIGLRFVTRLFGGAQ